MLIDADGVIEFPLRAVKRGDLIIEWYAGNDGKMRVMIRRPGVPQNENARLRALVAKAT